MFLFYVADFSILIKLSLTYCINNNSICMRTVEVTICLDARAVRKARVLITGMTIPYAARWPISCCVVPVMNIACPPFPPFVTTHGRLSLRRSKQVLLEKKMVLLNLQQSLMLVRRMLVLQMLVLQMVLQMTQVYLILSVKIRNWLFVSCCHMYVFIGIAVAERH